MKPEQLDSLLLDRALGELSPEVSALLDAHLAQHATAAQRAAEFSASVTLARAAVAPGIETPQPLDVARLHRAAPIHRILPTEMLRLAACLAVGLTLGWLVRPSRPTAPVIVASTTPTALRPLEPASQFWSVAHFAPEAKRSLWQKKP